MNESRTALDKLPNHRPRIEYSPSTVDK